MDEDRLSRAEIFRYNEEFVARAAAAVGATTYRCVGRGWGRGMGMGGGGNRHAGVVAVCSVRLNEFADMLPHELKQRLAPAAASAGVAAARAALPAATDTPAREEAPPPTRVDWSAFTLPAAGDLDVPSSLHVATAASVISGPAAGGSAGEGAAPRRVDPMWLMYCTACADAGDLGCLLAFLATTPRLCTTADCDAQCDADIRGVSVVGGEPRDLRAAVARAPVVAAVRAATPGFLLYNDGVYE